MKTMMNLDGTQIIRVSEEEASRLFSEGYRYIAKSIWKEKVRDVEKTHDEVQDGKLINKKSNKMSKAAKRHSKKSQ
jgi:hypothetical protein